MKDNVDEIKCPKCMSQNIHAGKKGFSTGKAIAGTIIANPVVGAIAGTHRSNKIVLTCLNCEHQFKPGEQFKTKPVPKKLPDGVNVNKAELDESYSILAHIVAKCQVLLLEHVQNAEDISYQRKKPQQNKLPLRVATNQQKLAV